MGTDDMLAALIPDTPATLTPAPRAGGAPLRAEADGEVPSVAALLELARRQGVLEGRLSASNAAHSGTLVPHPTTQAPAEVSPIVPRWAIGTAVAALGVGGGLALLGVAVEAISSGLAALAAGAAAGLPLLLLGAFVLAAMVGGRRKSGGSLEITQHVAMSVTQAIKGGRR
ncbi:hypothetical protein [Streptomyces sp. NPDC048349]|uniref:hypothetical protein n=1 Tax=Streptomyces sp. NPDC048349 TaxID=3155486 RepID=UPI00342565DB